MTLEEIFILERKLPSFTRVGMLGIIGDAKRDFTGGEVGKVLLNGLINDLRSLNGAAKTVKRNRACGD